VLQIFSATSYNVTDRKFRILIRVVELAVILSLIGYIEMKKYSRVVFFFCVGHLVVHQFNVLMFVSTNV
jgi:hypothetical protein